MINSHNEQNPNILLRSLRRVAGAVGLVLILASCASPANRNTSSRELSSTPANPASSTPGVSSSPSQAPADMTVDPSPDLSRVVDNQLLAQAAQNNLFEIQASQLAAQKATNPEVKQFAQTIVKDRTQAAKALQQLATARGVSLPADMGDQNKALLARLSPLSGAEFDRAYMTETVNSHQQDLALARNQANNGRDQELKSLAAEKLPYLEGKLRLAQKIAQQSNG